MHPSATGSFVVIALLITLCAQAADLSGSSDHALLPRYDGAEILKYESRVVENFGLIDAHIDVRGGEARNRDAYILVEGKLTRVGYRMPAGRSVLEIVGYYEKILRQAGFEILFACGNEECSKKVSGRDFNEAATPRDMAVYMANNEKDQRYLLARLSRAGGDVYAALYMNRAYSLAGQNKDRVFANLLVVETAPQPSAAAAADATALARALTAQGHVAVYGIALQGGGTALKNEAGTAVAEIATLLKAQPQLKLLVVAHTDNAGSYTQGRVLSERLATAVVAALAAQHGIDAGRLVPVGVGMAAPLASNAAEAGRAKNRRLELVKQ